MEVRPTEFPDVALVEPRVFGDSRGFFLESFNRRQLEAALGRTLDFVQDNHSLSARNVLRGIHYQLPHPQGKLVRVIRGEVFDVAVDLRRGSPTFGLSPVTHEQADTHQFVQQLPGTVLTLADTIRTAGDGEPIGIRG